MTQPRSSEFLAALRALPLRADGHRAGTLPGTLPPEYACGYVAYHAANGSITLDGDFKLAELAAILQWTVECLAEDVAATYGTPPNPGR